MAANEPAWPSEYPVDGVKVSIGQTLDGVDEAEYTDLRRQGLIVFDEPAEQPAEQPTAPAAPRGRQGGSE